MRTTPLNIFYLSASAERAARYHYDRHVVKMVLEYAQLLSTAHVELDDSDHPLLYKPTHVNHPSGVWCRASHVNYQWLASLLRQTAREYTYRYGKVHMTERKGLVDLLQTVPANIPHGPFTQPTQCMPDEYKGPCSIRAYRRYYMTDKARLFAYTNRDAPAWTTRTTFDSSTPDSPTHNRGPNSTPSSAT